MVVSLSSEERNKLFEVEHAADSRGAGDINACALQSAMKGERGVDSLRETKCEQLAVLLHDADARAHGARRLTDRMRTMPR